MTKTIRPADEEALERLHFHLELEDAFWLGLVVGADRPARRWLRQAAAADCRSLGVDFDLHALPHDELHLLAPVLAGAGTGLHWVLVDSPDPDERGVWEHAAGQLLLAMNERREAYRRHLGAGVVLEGPETLKVQLRNLAPDLFSVRSFILEPGWAVPRMDESSLGPVRRRKRTEARATTARSALTAARRLQELPGEGARRSRLSALARAVTALIEQGWVSEAIPSAQALRTEAYQAAALHSEDRWLLSMVAEADEHVGAIAAAMGEARAALGPFRTACWVRGLLVKRSRSPSVPSVDGIWPGAGPTRRDAPCGGRARPREVRPERGPVRAPGDRGDPGHGSGSARGAGHELVAARHLYLARDELELARRAYDAALRIRQELARAHSNVRYRRHLSVAWGRVGTVAERADELPLAIEARERALKLAREIADLDESNVAWQLEASVAWSRFGDALVAAEDHAAAEAAYGTAVLIRERLATEDPENGRLQQYLATGLAALAETAAALGEEERGRAYAQRALGIADELMARDPENLAWLRAHERAFAAVEAIRSRRED